MDNANEPAFPWMRERIDEQVTRQITHGGLTKREHFAGLAMQAMVNALHSRDSEAVVVRKLSDAAGIKPSEFLASRSVMFADALLAALEKEPK